MTVAPNHQNLIIPGKTRLPRSSGDYGTDMRTIEQWANEGIVRKLIAGSNITLTPSSGVDAGQGIEIAASGGGGGSSGVGIWNLVAGPDQRAFNGGGGPPFGIPFSGLSMSPTRQQLFSNFLTPSNPAGSGHQTLFPYTTGWLWNIGAGQSASFLPILTAPAFTGGPCYINFSIFALALNFLDQAIYQTNDFNVTTGLAITTADTDFSIATAPPSGDLTLSAGTAFENGLISSAGTVYFGACQVQVAVPPGVTFT